MEKPAEVGRADELRAESPIRVPLRKLLMAQFAARVRVRAARFPARTATADAERFRDSLMAANATLKMLSI